MPTHAHTRLPGWRSRAGAIGSERLRERMQGRKPKSRSGSEDSMAASWGERWGKTRRVVIRVEGSVVPLAVKLSNVQPHSVSSLPRVGRFQHPLLRRRGFSGKEDVVTLFIEHSPMGGFITGILVLPEAIFLHVQSRCFCHSGSTLSRSR